MTPKNCIICLVDALRYDVMPGRRQQGKLSELGLSDRLDTPTLDWMVDQGTIIPNFHSTYGSTPPAAASLLTGLYPREHHVFDFFRPMDSGCRTLADVFNDHEFHTIMGNGHIFMKETGIRSRFDEWIQGPPQKMIDRIKELNEKGRRVFLYYHTFDVHGPYCLSRFPAKQEYHRDVVNLVNQILGQTESSEKFTLEDALEESDRPGVPYVSHRDLPIYEFVLENINYHFKQERQVFEDPVSLLSQMYVEGVNLFDRYHLKQFKNFLRADDSGDETFFLLTADHGETVQDEATDVPTFSHRGKPEEQLIRIPGVILNSARQVTSFDPAILTSLVDVYPTILEQFNFDASPDSVSGVDLFELDPENERTIYAEHSETIKDVCDSDTPEEDRIFPLPGVLGWQTILNSKGYKYYRKGISLNDEDYDRSFETFIKLAFAKVLFSWPEDDVIEDLKDDFEDLASWEERKVFVESLRRKSKELGENWSPELYHWRDDPHERENLLSNANEAYQSLVDDLDQLLQDRFMDPLLLDTDPPTDIHRDDREEIVEGLKDLGYL